MKRTKQQHQASQHPMGIAQKRPYTPPRLQKLGTVDALTRGSGSGTDGGPTTSGTE
jgi:hypothetical protein